MGNSLPAGVALDALVAETVFGWVTVNYAWYDGTAKPLFRAPDAEPARGDDFESLPDGRLVAWNALPAYSTQMNDAWDIVPVLQAAGFGVELTAATPDSWAAKAWRRPTHIFLTVGGETAPLALCRLALAAFAPPVQPA